MKYLTLLLLCCLVIMIQNTAFATQEKQEAGIIATSCSNPCAFFIERDDHKLDIELKKNTTLLVGDIVKAIRPKPQNASPELHIDLYDDNSEITSFYLYYLNGTEFFIIKPPRSQPKYLQVMSNIVDDIKISWEKFSRKVDDISKNLGIRSVTERNQLQPTIEILRREGASKIYSRTRTTPLHFSWYTDGKSKYYRVRIFRENEDELIISEEFSIGSGKIPSVIKESFSVDLSQTGNYEIDIAAKPDMYSRFADDIERVGYFTVVDKLPKDVEILEKRLPKEYAQLKIAILLLKNYSDEWRFEAYQRLNIFSLETPPEILKEDYSQLEKLLHGGEKLF